ncbi:MAG: sigma factor [Peptostreptococcaceae bacterium]
MFQDKLMIKYIKKKNPKGMDMLIEDYSGIITSVVRNHLGTLKNYEEECVSDVLFSVWESINGYEKDKNSFKNWVCAIAKYKSINYRKKYLSKPETIDITLSLDNNLGNNKPKYIIIKFVDYKNTLENGEIIKHEKNEETDDIEFKINID